MSVYTRAIERSQQVSGTAVVTPAMTKQQRKILLYQELARARPCSCR